jgi:AcrR family transcriptional regulator
MPMRPETLERRREILDAALDVFGSKGSANGTLVDIAEQVGMTHAGILHHYGSKDQLLLEVLRHRDETDVAALESGTLPEGMDLFRHLVRTAIANAQRAGIVQTYVVLSAESVTDGHPARDYFVARYRTLRADIANAFAAVCAERGIVEPATVGRATASIIAVMDGLQVQWLLEPGAVELAAATEFAIGAILSDVLGERVSI